MRNYIPQKVIDMVNYLFMHVNKRNSWSILFSGTGKREMMARNHEQTMNTVLLALAMKKGQDHTIPLLRDVYFVLLFYNYI